ncbi:interleukin-31 receptor subunit alpha-like [Polyodon spathula]|uniref:interleukin-31 receptor subunit alpha-like n=1 Tax=Polyodon spathula TaxID=7913 RepID=UPI001B7EA73F|nr:interleukin-31 receptor subunit alpha-like [Polyodon spathula]
MLIIVYLVAVVIFMVPCQGKHEDCDIFPKNPVVEMGSDLLLTFAKSIGIPCLTYDPRKIIWKLNGKKIPEEHYSFTNSTGASVVIRNVSYPTGDVSCNFRVAGKDILIAVTDVKAGFPPEKPQNISCIQFYQKNVACSWDPGRNTFLETEFNITYMFGYDFSEILFYRTKQHTYQFEDGHLQLYAPLSVTVKAENALGEAVSDVLHVFGSDIVKLEPPEISLENPILRSSIRINWRRPKAPRHLSLNCEVQHQETGSNKWSVSAINMSRKKEESFDITNLKPFTNYTVSVRCIGDEMQIHWSDWSREITATSHGDVPSEKPDLWRQINAPDGEGNRIVQLLWKALQISTSNDGTFWFRVQCKSKSKPWQDLVFNTTSMKAALNLTKEAFEISVVAFNSFGDSPKAILVVPAVDDKALQQVKEVEAFSYKDLIWVKWKTPDVPVNAYVIDWCMDDETCEADWQYTNTTNVSLNAFCSVGAFDPCKRYNITVYALFDGKPGLPVTVQTYLKEAAPGPVSDVQAFNVQQTTATIKWREIPENERHGFITNYTIFYKDDKGLESYVTVNSSILEYLLDSLQPNTKYVVHVMASTKAGGTNSSETFFTTVRYSLYFIKYTSLAAGLGIIMIIILGISTCAVVKKYLLPEIPDPAHSSIGKMPLENIFTAKSKQDGENFVYNLLIVENISDLPLQRPSLISAESKLLTPVNPPRGPSQAQLSLDYYVSGDGYRKQMLTQKMLNRSLSNQPLLSVSSTELQSEPGSPSYSRNEESPMEDISEINVCEETPSVNAYLKNSVKARELVVRENKFNLCYEKGTTPEPSVMSNAKQNSAGQAYVTADMFSHKLSNACNPSAVMEQKENLK